jgi:hypothetical protein
MANVVRARALVVSRSSAVRAPSLKSTCTSFAAGSACSRPASTRWRTCARRASRPSRSAHLEWKATAEKIATIRAAGVSGPVVLVGHSQGGKQRDRHRRELEKQSIPVELIVTIAPFLQTRFGERSCARSTITSRRVGVAAHRGSGFKGEISNITSRDDLGILHINIDKDARVQAAILGAIEGVP